MTLDDRAHRAADGLRRSVRGSVDAEDALSAVTGRRHRRWVGRGGRSSSSPERVLAAVAAVAMLMGTVAFAVTRDQSGGVDTEGDRDRRLIEVLPAGPLDGKESLRLPMLVTPQKGVSEGSVVRISGRGFEPHEPVGTVMCTSEADTGHAGVDACQLGETFEWVTYGEADAEGIVSVRVPLRRFVDTPKYGRVDCLSGPERCLVAVGATLDYDRSGGAYVQFAGAPDFPTPTVSVAPTQGLADGQAVQVMAQAMVPGRTYLVEQCATDDRCAPLAYGRPGDDGSVTTSVIVQRELATSGAGSVDCTTGCELRVGYVGPEGASSVPLPAPVAIAFDPSAPPVTVAPTTAPPTTGAPSTVPSTGSTEPPPSTVVPFTTPSTGSTEPPSSTTPTTTGPPTTDSPTTAPGSPTTEEPTTPSTPSTGPPTTADGSTVPGA